MPPAPRPHSLSWRLSVSLTVLLTLTSCAALAAYVLNARQNVGRESAAARELAQALLSSQPLQDGIPVVRPAAADELAHVRHLRLVAPGREPKQSGDVPAWFRGAARLAEAPAPLPLRVGWPDGRTQEMSLVADADDELAEIWSNVENAVLFTGALVVLLNLGSWWIVRRQLLPLRSLTAALDSIGSGERDVRIDVTAVQEVALVQERFNHMAAALQDAAIQNRRLIRELLRVQEEERRSIARELHDEFAQQITAIHTNAAVLRRLVPEDGADSAALDAIRGGATDLMRMVRGRLRLLRPEVLDEFGLAPAIEELASQFRGQHPGLDIRLDLDADLPIGDEQAICLVRIVQEALTNVARHARARSVRLHLHAALSEGLPGVALSVIDDGIGPAPSGITGRGFGLLGMQERLDGLGGKLVLQAGSGGHGWHLRAWLPGRPAERLEHAAHGPQDTHRPGG